MKKLAVLGSTGSIGRNTLNVIQSLNNQGFEIEVEFLSAFSNSELLLKQVKDFNVKSACIFDGKGYSEINEKFKASGCKLFKGFDGIIELINTTDYNLLVNALVGFSGLIPTIEVIKRGKDIALANKESLVIAGDYIYSLLKNSKSKLIPIDSEHSAILQCLQGEKKDSVSSITLTASGGPFLNLSRSSLESVSIEQALNHPNWKMGNKITIDSATLMNKGFEIIEARWLFDIAVDKINVLIHPQSIIHSMVEFVDGSVKAQLGCPDMKLPIQYAIMFPERVVSDYPRLNLMEMQNLTFFEPDFDKFECLKLAYDVIKMGGSYPVVLNASNEVAVELFLNKKIRFLDIPYIIKQTLDKNSNHFDNNLENIIAADTWSRDFVKTLVHAAV